MPDAELHQVISRLRDELQLAMSSAQGQRIGFELGPVEITLNVSVEQHAGGKAGVKFWVVQAGADGGRSRSTGQTIKLTLLPKDLEGGPDAGGQPRSPTIAGSARADEIG